MSKRSLGRYFAAMTPEPGRRCACGKVEVPRDWSGVVTQDGHVHKHHYWDGCAEMIVYDETAEIRPEAWARLAVGKNDAQ